MLVTTMSHYEERLERDIEAIHADLVRIGRNVERAVGSSLDALLNLDRDLAYRTILGDLEINRDIRALDARCHAFVARHLPSAGHLRFVSSILRMTIEVERIGDYACSICRAAVQLEKPLSNRLAEELRSIGLNALQMYRETIDAFESSDHLKAEGLKSQADLIERSFVTGFEEIIDDGRAGLRELEDSFDLFIALNRFERTAAQAKNLCEEIIFWLTGARKPSKKYRILFLDNTGDGRLKIALAFGHKTFPNSASYGADVTPSVDPDLAAFLQRKGLDGSSATVPDWSTGSSDAPHIIVVLSGDVGDYMEKVPFHSVVFKWDLPGSPNDASGDERTEAYERMLQAISGYVQDLIEALRGKENAI